MKIKKKKLFRIVTIGVLTSIIVTLASLMGYLDFMQRKALDLMIWMKKTERPSRIIIIAIDDEAFRSLGEQQPLPRKKLASLIKLLRACGPKAIGLDISLESQTNPEDDKYLLDAISENTIIPFELIFSSEKRAFSPVKAFFGLPKEGAGFSSTYQDSDGIIRKTPLVIQDDTGALRGSFGFEIYRMAMKKDVKEIGRERFTGRTLSINYAGSAGSIAFFPAWPLIQIAETGVTPPPDNPFRDKIVLVGATFKASRDFFLTPKGMMSGVEIHANIINTLLTKTEVKVLHWLAGLAIQIMLCVSAGLLFLFFRPWMAVFIGIICTFIFFVPVSFYIFLKMNYWLDFVMPVAAVSIAGVINDSIERRKIQKAFSQHVSREVLEYICRDEESIEGARKNISVIFSDIRGFTSMSEEISLDILIPLLNEYLALMTETVQKNSGMINKFIGDAVMAIYGAPIERRDHAYAAAKTALAMVAALEKFNAGLSKRGLKPFRIGIGIHSGEVFAGSIGSERKKEYTIVGDTVNIASRIEQMNKELNTTILISEETYNMIGEIAMVVDKGPFVLRGKHQTIRLFELCGIRQEEEQ